MKKATFLAAAAGVCGVVLVLGSSRARGDEVPKEYRETVKKGLEWLAGKQTDKGSWGANGDQYPVSMTALSGMALLMEGSTIREGKYSKHIKKAVDWLMVRSQKVNERNGLIGDPTHPTETGRYMYGHGFALLFLASVYGEEDNPQRRAELKDILIRGVKYSVNAQSTQGGWYYTAKGDPPGADNDEGSVTITQVQGLRAARNAGIPVPKDAIKKAQDYLKNSTTERGGVVYSLGRGGFRAQAGGERPALTAAAISCAFNSGDYSGELPKKWFKFCQTAIPLNANGVRQGHDEYTHYYYAQALYMLGDNGWDKLFGNAGGEKLTWSKYRELMFDRLKQTQSNDGSWPSGGGFSVGPVYSTAVYLTILQLDKGTLPIYQR